MAKFNMCECGWRYAHGHIVLKDGTRVLPPVASITAGMRQIQASAEAGHLTADEADDLEAQIHLVPLPVEITQMDVKLSEEIERAIASSSGAAVESSDVFFAARPATDTAPAEERDPVYSLSVRRSPGTAGHDIVLWKDGKPVAMDRAGETCPPSMVVLRFLKIHPVPPDQRRGIWSVLRQSFPEHKIEAAIDEENCRHA